MKLVVLLINLEFIKKPNKLTVLSSLGTESTTRSLQPKRLFLSAGAINTPQLLLLSGIGPKDDLEKLK
ncbi:hypothetical protein Anas_07299, partial [Armadillidium nasatum]